MYSWYLFSSPSAISQPSELRSTRIQDDLSKIQSLTSLSSSDTGENLLFSFQKRTSGVAIEWCLDNHHGRCLDWFDMLEKGFRNFKNTFLATLDIIINFVHLKFGKDSDYNR